MKWAFAYEAHRVMFREMTLHKAFFDALGSIQVSDQAWAPGLAGLSILRIVDGLAIRPHGSPAARRVSIDAARTVALSIKEGDPSRAILLRTLELLDQSTALTPELASELTMFGRSLDLEGKWTLAADVFQTISELFRSREHKRIVIESLILLAAAARNIGDWETSDSSYAEAQHLADSIGDDSLSLTAQVGIANSHIAHGNLSAADRELREVLTQATALGFQQVEALALHASAYRAITSGDYQGGLHFGYRSLELTTNQTARDRVLGDIAAAFAGLGLNDAARDGYSIVAVTSPHRWVRWQATLNLMELAIGDGDEVAFDDYLAQMEGEPLDPRLRVYFHWFKARGFRKFGRDGAEELFDAAHAEAVGHQLHQLALEVESEAAQPAASVPAISASGETNGEIARIAEALFHLREDLVAGKSPS